MEPFVGEIRMVGFDLAPVGWAHCNGQLLPIDQYPALFSLIGTLYGGDGVSTFALPDFTGRVPMHRGEGPGLTQRNQGEVGGQVQVTLGEADLPAHSHLPQGTTFPSAQSSPEGAIWSNPGMGNPPFYSPPTNLAPMAAAVVATAGGTQPHTNLQPYLCVSFIIWLQGEIYPAPG